MRRIHAHLCGFLRARRASMVVEAVIIVPFMLLIMVGFQTFWQASQTSNSLQKATFVATDLLAREMVAVDDTYLNGLARMVDYMTRSNGRVQMRISSIVRVSGLPTDTTGLEVLWSYSPQSRITALTTGTIGAVRPKLPFVSVGGTVVVIETRLPYSPAANVGFPSLTLTTTFAMPPRYVPMICRKNMTCFGGS